MTPQEVEDQIKGQHEPLHFYRALCFIWRGGRGRLFSLAKYDLPFALRKIPRPQMLHVKRQNTTNYFGAITKISL
ncbi:MAG: hypothetical protein BAA00_18520 [Parageobacillus thermoglucosidasius]|nr:MAG: hypothetical protein BAA00_18520 [Parageobacillus thermoglucosidasius]